MITAGRLNAVQSLDDVLVFLREELDWPTEDLDLDDAAFDYEPAELGIDPAKAPDLVTIQELRPLVADQVWGIFFLEFDGPRLQVTQLRLLLNRLVTKKRGQGDGSLRSWALEDLLFVVTTDSGQSVELHLLAFVDDGGNLPTLRSLPWRPDHSPHQHLTRLENELLPHLTWPDDPSDSNSWRSEWRKAFVLEHGEAITTASRLATRMADVARHLRNLIASALEAEGGEGPFNTLLNEVRTELIADADGAEFADMCAQTLVYGVLTARIMDPESFGASPLLSSVPLSNPFLSAFFEEIHDQALALDLDDSGLEALVVDLRSSNIETVLDQFEESGGYRDPVIHFYEEFLKEYDRSRRMNVGAFYTPHEVVRFMVRAVDEILKTRFGLSDGVADAGTWAQVAESNNFDVPDGIDPKSPFVSMIDPATGTGTFLIEWLRQAEVSFKENHSAEDWPTHLEKHVLPSMHAFELMLGPYAIAHLKLAREIHPHGIPMNPDTVLLTDTLEHPALGDSFELFQDPVALEGRRADRLKTDQRFTVCIGNPPYNREQRSPTAGGGKRQGGVVRYGAEGLHPLLGSYVTPLKEAGQGKHAKNLYNLYVYFWRWATWQTTELPEGPGITAFITASSFLTGPGFAGMRQHLTSHFDEILVIDLGGDGRGARIDDNVFDILTPVTIVIAFRRSSSVTSGNLRYQRIEGGRADKLAALSTATIGQDKFTLVGDALSRSFIPLGDSPYHAYPLISDLFPWLNSGCQVKRTWPIGPSRDVLTRRWAELCGTDPKEQRTVLRETANRTPQTRIRGLFTESRLTPIAELETGMKPEAITRYGYRSFDRAFIIADKRVIDAAKEPLWRASGTDQIVLTTLTTTTMGRGPALTVTPYVPDLDHFRGSYGARNMVPLWRDRLARYPNVTAGILDHIAQILNMRLTATDLAAYVYGLGGTAAFSNQFFDELGEAAGPIRIPMTADPGLCEAVRDLGRDLLWWHTWGERFVPEMATQLPGGSATELAPVTEYPNEFSYSDGVLQVGSGRFGPISPEVWEFEVSGLQVIKSWLGYRMWDRKGKKSSPLDDIRPEAWTFSEELLLLLSIIEHTVEVAPLATELLEQVVNGPLIPSTDLPKPTEAERKAPKR